MKGYNLLISHNRLLSIPVALDRQLMTYIQANYIKIARPAGLNEVRKGIYCLILINQHLNWHLNSTKRLLLKWKKRLVRKAAISLLLPFVLDLACHSIQSGRSFPTATIICAQEAYLRSIEFRLLNEIGRRNTDW